MLFAVTGEENMPLKWNGVIFQGKTKGFSLKIES
jgi:hypothetical protein